MLEGVLIRIPWVASLCSATLLLTDSIGSTISCEGDFRLFRIQYAQHEGTILYESQGCSRRGVRKVPHPPIFSFSVHLSNVNSALQRCFAGKTQGKSSVSVNWARRRSVIKLGLYTPPISVPYENRQYKNVRAKFLLLILINFKQRVHI